MPARKRWLVLPCVESLRAAGGSTTLHATEELSLLPPTLPSTLQFRVRTDRPDAIVIVGGDALLGAAGTPTALSEIFREIPTILLDSTPSTAAARHAARMNIYSVLPLKATQRQFEAAIAATIEGFSVTLPRFPGATIDTAAQIEHLTVREMDVLRLMARGYRNKHMATQLDISEHTIKFHVSSVLAKLGARTRTAAVTIGVTRGLVAI
jgi:DNA-binding NarL/FixJ family response regulator